jgi:hypothetical protein
MELNVKRNILAVIIMMMSGSTFATGLIDGPEANANAAAGANAQAGANAGASASNKVYNTNVNRNSLSNRNYNTNVGINKQGQRQGQGQLQGQGQGQQQGQSANNSQGQSQGSNYQGQSADNAGNTQSIVIQGPPAAQSLTYDGKYRLETVATAYAPNIYPTSPCMGSTSGGVTSGSWLFGLSFGTSWTDEECQKQEASRNAPTPADRIHVWCQSKFAAGSPSCQGIVMPTEKGAVTGSLDTQKSEPERRADATVKVAPGMEAWVLAPR